VAFDPSDYRSLLDSGVVVYGALPIKSTTKDDLAKAVRENLSKNVLCGGMNIGKASMAACVLLGQPGIIDAIPMENVDHAYEMLGRVIGGGIIHRGIYNADRSLSAYTLIGGLSLPKDRLDEISRIAGHTDWDA
jgi:hypothetical protein